jgi:transcriptional regulator with XRE-family HTH domain
MLSHMAESGDPAALGQLLRSRRERLRPADVGLPPGSRRRAAGLRREEVALLANMSATYYTFLEQGRKVRPSPQVLDALASALRMSAAERRYLEVLAYGPRGPGGLAGGDGRDGGDGHGGKDGPPPEQVDRRVLDLIDRLDPYPTYLKGRRWDVLAANAAARELFTDWDALPGRERNLVSWMFTSARAREVHLDWEAEARGMLGRFRLVAARHPNDPDFVALTERLRQESPHVREWWPRHDVTSLGAQGTKKLLHPRLGPIEYTHVVLQVADSSQTLVTFSPA